MAPATSHPLIGLIGRKRAGKDTVADVLVAEYGYTKVAFADPLKRAALALDPIVHVEAQHVPDGVEEAVDAAIRDRDPAGLLAAWMDGPGDQPVVARLSELVADFGWERAKDDYPEVRRTLQRLGTDAIRAQDSEFWVRAWQETIDDASGPVVATDCRFPNEADVVESRPSGLLVRVDRPSVAASDDSHASEVALDERRTAYTIDNDTDLGSLRLQARTLAVVVEKKLAA